MKKFLDLLCDPRLSDPVKNFETINSELEKYNPELMKKPMVVAGNKMDIAESDEKLKQLKDYCKKKKLPFFPISAATKKGVDELIKYLSKEVMKQKAKRAKKDE